MRDDEHYRRIFSPNSSNDEFLHHLMSKFITPVISRTTEQVLSSIRGLYRVFLTCFVLELCGSYNIIHCVSTKTNTNTHTNTNTNTQTQKDKQILDWISTNVHPHSIKQVSPLILRKNNTTTRIQRHINKQQHRQRLPETHKQAQKHKHVHSKTHK